MSDPRFMKRPSPEVLDRVAAIAGRELSVEEFDAYVKAPMSQDERCEILDSFAWFTKRYPTAGERLAAARRGYQQWVLGMPRRV
jgi:hypothetical protein